jgi:hypothetical protein
MLPVNLWLNKRYFGDLTPYLTYGLNISNEEKIAGYAQKCGFQCAAGGDGSIYSFKNLLTFRCYFFL